MNQFRIKSLNRRKKEDRLPLDMPTTDPGSDLLFSTDDECIDANGTVTCCGTMPLRVKRHLLKSKLQKHYIDQIGGGVKNMPPELIITSPTNKVKQKKQPVRIVYKASAAEKYARRSPSKNELPIIGQPPKRTRSWHNFNTPVHVPSISPYKAMATKSKSQSPFYRVLSKKGILNKADLDIKLSLKKKIWTGIQPDDVSLDIDHNRPLSCIAPNSLKIKKTNDNQNYYMGWNLSKTSPGIINKLDNEKLLTACSLKLMEWQISNTNSDASPLSLKCRAPATLEIPDLNPESTLYIFRQLDNVKTPCTAAFSEKRDNGSEEEKLATPSKVLEADNKYLSTSNPRHYVSTSHRGASKQTINQHKLNAHSTKFMTGELVVTAAQTGAIGSASVVAKKNKKLKSLHHKRSNVTSITTNNGECGEPSIHANKNNMNNKSSMTATATTIVRKVKTKLKKKKLPRNS